MLLPDLIAQRVLDVHEGGNWTEVDFTHLVQDVTLTEAITPTLASPNTLASLVRHLVYWNHVMARRAQGVATLVGPDNGFAGATLHTEADWLALQGELWQSARELAAAIRAVPAAKLAAPILPGYASAYKNLQGAVEHLHCHLGQMVLIKQLVRSILPA